MNYDKEQNTKVSFLFPKVLTERMDEVATNIGVSRSQLLRKSTKSIYIFWKMNTNVIRKSHNIIKKVVWRERNTNSYTSSYTGMYKIIISYWK